MQPCSAIIADDERNLCQDLQTRLNRLWPALQINGIAQNGAEALQLIRREEPEIAFLDIKMPVMDGLTVAMHCEGRCRVVFITAYDDFAIQAFEHHALDYLVKPVTDERLQKTILRLQAAVTATAMPPANWQAMIEQLARQIRQPANAAPLQWIRAGRAEKTLLIAVDDVLYFQAGDKYTAVVTRDGEYVIRKTIKELTGELDATHFWQINRGSIVNVRAIQSTQRELNGRCKIHLKYSRDVLLTSRKYAHLFKQM